MKIAWSIKQIRNLHPPSTVAHAMRNEHTTLCNIPITAHWYVEDTDQPDRVTCVRCQATMNSPLADDRVEAI